MKLLLFRPNSEVYSALPPLGFLSLAAYLRQYGGHEVRIFDGRLKCASDSGIAGQVEDFQPDIIGVGLLSMERQVGHHALLYLRKKFPQTPLIMGGPYPTSEPLDALKNEAVDFLVQNEGEIPALNLLNAMQYGGDFSTIRGLVYRRQGEVVINAPEDFIEDLDSIPDYAWDLIHLPDYYQCKGRGTQMNIYKKYVESAPLQVTRGCPYQCTYCQNFMGRKFRRRSAERVIEELRFLKRTYGVREIEFIDDTFNLNLKYAKNFYRALIDADLGLYYSYPNGLRADRMDEELVDLMKQAGVFRIVYGIESGSPRIQKTMKKNLDLEKARQMIALTAGKNISVGSFYMLGFLDETEEEMRRSINFAVESKAHTASFFLLNPYPNTEIYRQALEAGYQLQDTKYGHYYSLCSNISKVSAERILSLRNYAYRRFFFNPVRLIRLTRTTPFMLFFFKIMIIGIYMLFVKVKEDKRTPIGSSSDEGIYKKSWVLRLLYRHTGLSNTGKTAVKLK